MSETKILALVDRAFGASPRPEHFTNFNHCDECAEHDELLRSRDRDTLTVDDVGNAGWDPLSFTSSAGFAYYMPKLVRLALEAREPLGGLWYAGQLMTHFWHGGRYNKHLHEFDTHQRQAVIAFAEFLINDRPQESGPYAEDLLQVHDYWTAGPQEPELHDESTT
jgi:hypothetical protein